MSPSNAVTHFSAVSVATTINVVVKYIQDIQCTAGLGCDRMIAKYTRDDQCYIILNLCPSISPDDTTTQEYALCHTGRHPDAHGFRRLKQRLRQTGRLTPTALVKRSAESGFGPR